jgi:hypothetical protein
MSNRITNSPVTQTKGQKSKTSPPSQLYKSSLHEPSFTKEMYNQIGEKNLMELSEPQYFRDGRKYTKIVDGVHLDTETLKDYEDQHSLLQQLTTNLVQKNLDVAYLNKENEDQHSFLRQKDLDIVELKKINAKWMTKCDEMIKEVGELKMEIIELRTQNKNLTVKFEESIRSNEAFMEKVLTELRKANSK